MRTSVGWDVSSAIASLRNTKGILEVRTYADFFWEGEVRRIGRTAAPLMTRAMSTPEVAGIISNGLSYVNGGRIGFYKGLENFYEKVNPPTTTVANKKE